MRRRDLPGLLAATMTEAALAPQRASAQSTGRSHYERTAAEIRAGITPANYEYPPGNVLRHGADPTGAASCDAAFGNAISAATVLETGGIIALPPGIYGYSSGLAWNAPNINIVGTGTWDSNQMPRQPAPTTLSYTGGGTAIAVGRPSSGGAGTPYGGAYFSSFKLQGSPSAAGGFHLYYSTTAKLERLLIRDFTRTGASGVYADDRWQDITSLDWIEFNHNYTGLTLAAVNDSTDINNCKFQYHTGPAVVLGRIAAGTSSHVVSFKNCQFFSNGSDLRAGAADVQILSGNTINFVSCYFENGLGADLYNVVVGDVTGSPASTIVRNVNFYGCFFQGSGKNRCAIQVANDRVFNLNFHGCTFLNFAAAAIDNSLITGSRGSVCVDPSCSLNATPAFFANPDPTAGVTYRVPAPLAVFQNSVAFGPGGATLRYLKVLTARVASFTAIAPNSTQTRTIGLEGIAPTDLCLAMPPGDLRPGLALAAVSVRGANTVDVRLANVTTEAITPGSMSLALLVIGR